jgi:transcriptional regulator with PAS, ATPase and Fis domain
MLYDVTLVLIVIALILLTGNTIYRIKEHRIDETIRKRRRLLAQALQASQTRVWTYDIASSTFIWMDKDFQPQRHYTNEEFARRHSADDNERLHRGMDELISQKKTSTALLMEEFDEERGEHCINDVTLSLLCHKDGNPRLIVGTNRISGKSTQLKENLKEQSYYQSIFNTVMVDMSLFDGKGYLLDMNNRAQHTYKIPLNEALKRKVRLDEVIDPEIFKHIH